MSGYISDYICSFANISGYITACTNLQCAVARSSEQCVTTQNMRPPRACFQLVVIPIENGQYFPILITKLQAIGVGGGGFTTPKGLGGHMGFVVELWCGAID